MPASRVRGVHAQAHNRGTRSFGARDLTLLPFCSYRKFIFCGLLPGQSACSGRPWERGWQGPCDESFPGRLRVRVQLDVIFSLDCMCQEFSGFGLFNREIRNDSSVDNGCRLPVHRSSRAIPLLHAVYFALEVSGTLSLRVQTRNRFGSTVSLNMFLRTQVEQDFQVQNRMRHI